MKATFRQSMTWLHTWTGLLLGWLCFAIFLTGTASYFRWEITRWMMPEIRHGATPLDAARAALAHLATSAAAESPQWFVDLPDERVPATVALWRVPGAERRFETEVLDARTGGKVAARGTRGGEFFYRFHFQLQLPHPWGRYLAGVAAMTMFVALITGVIAHRQFFADFFTFRAGRPGLRSWLDFHNVTAVLALPFYFMITYSALVIFIAMYMPWGRQILSDPTATPRGAARAANAGPGSPAATRAAAPQAWIAPADLEPMLRAAEQAWGTDGRTVKRIVVADRGTDKCTVTLTRAQGPRVSIAALEQLRFNGVTGAVLTPPPPAGGAATAAHDVLYGLHVARFAGPTLRGLFAVMGLMGTALIATGLVMWTVKRRPQQRASRLSFGHGLVERLNIATLAGLPLACAAFFWSNRLLPVGLDGRAEWEIKCFFIAWSAALLHPLVRPVFAAWREQLWTAAALFLLLPLLDAVVTGDRLLAALVAREGAYLGFDVAMLACGLALLTAARRLGRRAATSGPIPAPAPQEAAA